MRKVSLYIKGSCLGNPGAGGWAYLLKYNEHRKEGAGGESGTTNNRMELLALVNGVKALKEPCELTIFSTSEYITKGVSQWIKEWSKNDFRGMTNSDLWKEYHTLSQNHLISATRITKDQIVPEITDCEFSAKTQANFSKRQINIVAGI